MPRQVAGRKYMSSVFTDRGVDLQTELSEQEIATEYLVTLDDAYLTTADDTYLVVSDEQSNN